MLWANICDWYNRKAIEHDFWKTEILLALAGQWETHIVNLVMGNISPPILTYKIIYRAVFDVTAIFLIVLAT